MKFEYSFSDESSFNIEDSDTSDEDAVFNETKDPFKKAAELCRNREHTNARVVILNEHYDVHLVVLQINSSYFTVTKAGFDPTIPHVRIFELPSEKVSMWAFKKLYDWMLDDNGRPEPERILETLEVAKYLGIKVYVRQCNQIFSNYDSVNEAAAFNYYLEARERNMEDIVEICLPRISLFFLPMVSSLEFVLMPVDDLVVLLSQDDIYIHSEIEVFLAGVRWLNHKWEDRKQFTLKVMSCVRFALMPSEYLLLLIDKRAGKEINNVTQSSDVAEIINTANVFIAYKFNLQHLTDEEFKERCKEARLTLPKPRTYGQDRFFKHLSSYRRFLLYLIKLTKKDAEYYKSIHLVDPSIEDDESNSETGSLSDFDSNSFVLLRQSYVSSNNLSAQK